MNQVRFFVDAHVHLHRSFDPLQFLDAADRNFGVGASAAANDGDRLGCLMFADPTGSDSLPRLLKWSHEHPASRWQLRESRESVGLCACLDGEPRLALIAGRQIATAEGLEVLALATDAAFADGRPLLNTLDEVRRSDAIPVVPWGFGKWKLSRGKLIMQLIEATPDRETAGSREVFLGDNGGRCAALGEPSLFELARERGMRLLPGSDPLPFASHVERPGSCGFVLSGHVDFERPASSVKQLLAEIGQQPTTFGRLTRFDRFVVNQVGMQLRKRIG